MNPELIDGPHLCQCPICLETRNGQLQPRSPTPTPQPTPGPGRKDDSSKLPMELIPGEALEALARALGHGARKYAPDNWKLVPNPRHRYLGALVRHVTALLKGELRDGESGLSHTDHVLACAAFLAWFEVHGEVGATNNPSGNDNMP